MKNKKRIKLLVSYIEQLKMQYAKDYDTYLQNQYENVSLRNAVNHHNDSLKVLKIDIKDYQNKISGLIDDLREANNRAARLQQLKNKNEPLEAQIIYWQHQYSTQEQSGSDLITTIIKHYNGI